MDAQSFRRLCAALGGLSGPHLRELSAGATSDVEADLATGRKIECPTLLLWSEYLARGSAATQETPAQVWRRTFAPQVTDIQVQSGHFVPEEAPDETIAAPAPFLSDEFTPCDYIRSDG